MVITLAWKARNPRFNFQARQDFFFLEYRYIYDKDSREDLWLTGRCSMWKWNIVKRELSCSRGSSEDQLTTEWGTKTGFEFEARCRLSGNCAGQNWNS